MTDLPYITINEFQTQFYQHPARLSKTTLQITSTYPPSHHTTSTSLQLPPHITPRGRARGGWGWGSAPPDISSRKPCQNDLFIIIIILTAMLSFLDVYYTVGEVFSRPFQLYITSPEILKVAVDKTKKKTTIV